ncbi:MAG: GNAT family N-acetyltransferase [Hominenteromicrobium sp.]
MAYTAYCAEAAAHNLPAAAKSEFISGLRAASDDLSGLAAVENGVCVGYLLYSLHGGDELSCSIPLFGYGALGERREQTISRLFQRLAARVVQDRTVHFSAHLYACDTAVQRLFSYLQFGIIAEKGLCPAGRLNIRSGIPVRQLSKAEIEAKWNTIRPLLERLINHLRESPVFYPCSELTEAAYRSFLLNAGTCVFAAGENETIAGFTLTNPEKPPFPFSALGAENIGETYILPEYRGTDMAQALLAHTLKTLRAKGCGYGWVEHGTANPLARGFWNKYFNAFEYEFIHTVRRQD